MLSTNWKVSWGQYLNNSLNMKNSRGCLHGTFTLGYSVFDVGRYFAGCEKRNVDTNSAMKLWTYIHIYENLPCPYIQILAKDKNIWFNLRPTSQEVTHEKRCVWSRGYLERVDVGETIIRIDCIIIYFKYKLWWQVECLKCYFFLSSIFLLN